MKKYVVATLLLASAIAMQAGDGSVNFDNKVDGVVDAPVYEFTVGGTKLSGTNYRVMLYGGPEGTAEAALVAGDNPSGGTAYATFGTTASTQGYFSGTRELHNLGANGARASVQVRAWDFRTGATWESATTRGASNVFVVDTGDPLTTDFPGDMASMQSFAITTIPEPTTIGLGVLGVSALLMRRRKANA